MRFLKINEELIHCKISKIINWYKLNSSVGVYVRVCLWGDGRGGLDKGRAEILPKTQPFRSFPAGEEATVN